MISWDLYKLIIYHEAKIRNNKYNKKLEYFNLGTILKEKSGEQRFDNSNLW